MVHIAKRSVTHVHKFSVHVLFLRLFIQLSSGLQWCVWKEGVAHGVNCTDLAVINYIALSEHIVVDDDDLAVFAGTAHIFALLMLARTLS